MNKLTPSQQKLVEDNHNLIYAFLSAHNLSENDIEDWYGTMAIELCNAAMTYDDSKGYAFSTYAYKCMENGMKHAYNLRKQNAHTVLSLDEIIPESDDTTYADVIDSGTDFTDAFVDNDVVREAYEKLTVVKKKIVKLVFIDGYTSGEAAKMLKVSPQRTSKVCREFRSIVSRIDRGLL